MTTTMIPVTPSERCSDNNTPYQPMEYVYAALTLNETDAEITEDSLTDVLDAAGVEVEDARVKALVAALEDVDIDEAVAEATAVPAGAGASAGGAGDAAVEEEEAEDDDEDAVEEEEAEDDDEDDDAAGEGLGELFG